MPACHACGGVHSYLEGAALVRHEQLYAPRVAPGPWYVPADIRPYYSPGHGDLRLTLVALGERILSQRG
jgi:hypothetical protein